MVIQVTMGSKTLLIPWFGSEANILPKELIALATQLLLKESLPQIKTQKLKNKTKQTKDTKPITGTFYKLP